MRRSPAAEVTAFRLKRQVHKGCFLVVEGREDRLFFEKFVDPNTCRITVAGRKGAVVAMVAKLETACFSGIVGVVDADLDHIEGNQVSGDNLIVLETVDLEALMIRSSALDRVLIERGSEEKIAAFGNDVRKVLVAAAVWTGCLRLYSHRTRLNLKLRGLKYRKFVDKKSLAIDINIFVQKVMDNSQRANLSHPDIVEELRSIHRSLTNEWLICYGKDMVEVLAFGLRGVLGTKNSQNVKPEMIRRDLRMSFDWSDLNKSKLAQDLHEWTARNPGFRVLNPE